MQVSSRRPRRHLDHPDHAACLRRSACRNHRIRIPSSRPPGVSEDAVRRHPLLSAIVAMAVATLDRLHRLAGNENSPAGDAGVFRNAGSWRADDLGSFPEAVAGLPWLLLLHYPGTEFELRS